MTTTPVGSFSASTVRWAARCEPEIPREVAVRYTCQARRTVHSAARHRPRLERNAPVLRQLRHRAHRAIARRHFAPEFSVSRSAARPRSDPGFPRFECERSPNVVLALRWIVEFEIYAEQDEEDLREFKAWLKEQDDPKAASVLRFVTWFVRHGRARPDAETAS